MEPNAIEQLGLIAGSGAYPLELAAAARHQGVRRLFVVAFRGETDRAIGARADEVAWIRLGELGAMLEALRASGVRHAVMAGQIAPTHLFTVRPDKRLFDLLRRLRHRNAETFFGAIADELKGIGIELLPAHLFMESTMPGPGLLGRRGPTDSEQRDIELGLRIAKVTSGLEVGQAVVVKEGTVLAVEAFEGTDETIERASRLGGPGLVIVKVAKRGHDMRWDIPVIGLRTMKSLAKAKAAVLAVEAHRTILLEREKLVVEANRLDLCFTALETGASQP